MSFAPKHVATVGLSVLVVAGLLLAALLVSAPTTAAPNSVPSSSVESPAAGASVGAAVACGQLPVPLASASSYAVLASSTVTNTGATAITGNLGLSPGTSVTGFPPGKITGLENVTTPSAAGAEANLTIAYNNATARTNCPVSVAGNIGGQTLTPGLYKSTSSLAISSGDLTLSGGGNPNGVFIFQVASALTTTSGRAVILTDGAQAGNVFWVIGSSATLGTTSVMKGTVMAHDSISMLTGSVLDGRAMAETGEVSLAGSTLVVPTLASPPTYAVTFTESGLPANTSWSVELAGAAVSSLSSTIAFSVVSGTYAYSTTVAGYIATPSSGSLTVSGAAVHQAIVCARAAAGSYNVTFTESGLPLGTSWSITLNGATTSSATSSTGVAVPSGTYGYTVGEMSNYSSNPSSGSVTVNGTSTGPAIVFSSTASNGTTGPGGGAAGLSSAQWTLIALALVAAVVAAIVVATLVVRGRKSA